MKENNLVVQVWIPLLIGVIIILATYLIIDTKTKNIANDVIVKYLALEYQKVGWKDNYDKVNEITKTQIETWLQQYDTWWWQQPSPQANNAQVPAPTSSTISLEQAKKVTTDWTYILWNPDAEISFVEYSDLECPFCKKLHDAWTIDQVLEGYWDKVNFIFKHFPLNFHPNAPKEHEWAECAGELAWDDIYYKYINTIFKRTTWNGRWFSLSKLVPLAEELWIDKTEFQTCLDSWKYATKVQNQMNEWSSMFGISGTPWNVLINNKTGKWDKLPWAYPYESFKAKIDSLLQ